MTISDATHDLLDPEVVQQPCDYYRWLRSTDPVHEVVPGTFVVSRMDLIREVVNQVSVFSSNATRFLHKGDWAEAGLRSLVPGLDDGAEVPGIIATADPPDHERQRRVLAKSFSAANIRALEPAIRKLVATSLASVDDDRVEWMGRVAEPVPMVMVARLLGFDDDHAPALKQLGYAMVERIGGLVPEARMQALEASAMADLLPLLEAYAEARNGSDAYGDGIITVVADAARSGELDDVEAMGILTVLVAAGGESTTSLLGSAVRLLAEEPMLQQRLREDTDLVPAFVEESLRWDPPFRGHYRFVNTDTSLAGTAIPAGSHVVLMWAAANHDERSYTAPDEVRLDRPNARQHLGFGWGIHLCIGAPLARLEARVAIEELLAATSWVHVDADAFTGRYHPSLLVRRLESLPLILERGG